ncbi:PAS domain-containing protein [Glaciecola sp. MH2013]|uniref:PAS domain-containing protein n=1 Tax=Glaciecola sp. MH2013 TaxID=2785524 RepID=UPI0018A05116|nr:PAS domain-containing protein [Glaciecola sp. MH2013]MBF7075069.1 PAS domain-containing protein [Glaciecola sp. MH2013]
MLQQLSASLSVFKRSFFFVLIVISPTCFAFGGKLSRQDEGTLSLLAYASIGVMIVLAILAISAFIMMKKKDKQLEIHDEVIRNRNEVLDKTSSGILTVGLRGNIIEINQTAARLLGREASRVITQPLNKFFGEEPKDDINQALDSNESTVLVVKAPSSGFTLRLTITKNLSMYDGVAYVATIEDVDHYESIINVASTSLKELDDLVGRLNLGQVTVDFDNEKFEGNQSFAHLLGHDESLSGDFEALEKLICPDNLSFWNQSFELAKEHHECDFKTVLNGAENKVPVRILGVSSGKNKKGKSVQFKLLVINETQSRQNERRQYLSEQKVKAMLTVSTQPIYVLDEECRVVLVNSSFEKLFGVRLQEIKNKRFDLLNLMPEDINVLHNPDETPLTIGRALNREFSGKIGKQAQNSDELPVALRDSEESRHSNSTVHLRLTLQAFGDDKNNRAGFTGMVQDLTLLTDTKRQLDYERAHFSNLLDIAPIAVATVDADDKIVHANTAMTERLGLNEKELRKGTFYQLFNDGDDAGRAARQLHQTGRLRAFHTSLRGKNDVIHPSELHIDLLDKVKEQYVCWISDRSGESFQQQKFQGLLEHSSMPMGILDENGFTRLNPSACEFFGVESEEDLWGESPYALSLNKDDGDAYELERILNRVKYDGRAKTINWEHKVDSEIRACQATYIPIYKGKEFDSILCLWTDLTEIIQADQARLEAITAHKEAEREVAENQQLLRTSHEQLASKLKDLRDTETKLQEAHDEISEAKIEYINLQEKHKSVTENLQQVQQDYSKSREMLNEAKEANNALTEQLEISTRKVNKLQGQRNEISEQLKRSEENYKQAQEKLAASQAHSQKLEQEQAEQSQKMHAYVTQIDSLKASIQDKDAEISEVGSQINELQGQLQSSDDTSAKLKQALISQRKASEEAERQRREIENTYKLAQSELTNKVRHVEHLQNEMQKFEEMSKQEKGDMAAQQSKLMQELEAKQKVLQETQNALDEAKQAAEKEKQEKQRQQEDMQRLQNELAEAEKHAEEKLAEMKRAEQERLEQQQRLQEELKAKQKALQETESILSEAKQQTKAEKAEKLRQQELFDKLQAELAEMEQQSAEQAAKLEQSGKQWEAHQEELRREVEAKREQLESSQSKLDEIQQQAEAEKLARLEKEQKLEQLSVELSDVESRAAKQREMLEGSEEQWSAQQQQIEEQKKQLQQALREAEEQNQQLQQKLEGNLEELQQAESEANETKSVENKLTEELNAAKAQQEELESRIRQQEEQELALKKQVEEQQAALEGREESIQALQEMQEKLTAELQAVREEYSQSKQTLTEQQDNQSGLANQLATLEQELQASKAQLDDKEQALQSAQKQLESNEAILVEQENALVAAHKEELQQVQEQKQIEQQASSEPVEESPIAQMEMPESPSTWFDLLPYLQQQGQVDSLSTALNELIEELSEGIQMTDDGIMQDDNSAILRGARRLVQTGKKVNADALFDVISRLEVDCGTGMVDNISIAWPNTKRALNNTLRVIYENLNG